ncbi:hypothetical protein BaRGS_00007334 [Batillaria attramentaria]|uniref:HTH OST-type domain-containing protein n=1 Tax=Batillaria attramentaria TaxID=370345 RepID=A0ABD0LPQ2_9CAEN
MGDETRGAIGVFWDIENCNVPRFASALCLVQRVRERFFSGLREAEFMCVCDINKESKSVIEDLNSAQVNVVHINADSKNAADDKIKQSLRRFADTHPPDTKVILISSDVNFATDLSDLRHRKHMYVILIHQRHVHDALIACAHEHYGFDDIFADLPLKAPSKNLVLVVQGYPRDADLDLVKRRLRHLSYNCGGRVSLATEERAYVIFSNTEALNRARKRMEGADVLGGTIITSLSFEEKNASRVLSPSRYYQRNRSPATQQGVDRRHHSPAPGAPGDPYTNKHQRSNSNPRTQTQTQPYVIRGKDSYADLTTRLSASQHTEADFINYVCDMVQSKGTSPPSAASTEAEGSNDQPQLRKDGKMSRNMLMIQQQRYQEQQEHSSATGSPVTPSQGSTLNVPARFNGPLMPTPPGFDGSVPLQGVENGGMGTLNISKTVNLTYHSSYVPHLPCPRPMYPYQPYGSSFQPNHFMPIPRSRPQMRYGERPRYRNTSASQCRNGNARAILSSTPDVFGDEEEDVSEGDEVYSVDCGQSGSPVDLYVSNLDYNISSREWRKILASTFQPHVQVLGIFVRTQPDNTSLAVVKVPTLEDARFAISQFHRRKIGYKRIHVSLRNDGDQVPAESTRQESVSVLSDAKDYVMPVFKFIEQYEKRFHKSVSVSDLYKMKDVVEIIDRGGTGRMVRLSPGVCPTPTPQLENAPETALEEMQVQAVCPIHCPEGSTQHAEALTTNMLPSVRLQRKHFAAHVHSLLLSHNGVLPLMSFPVCYSAEFTALPVCQNGGVPLEHLLSCVPGVEIKVSQIGTKVIHFQENKEPPGAELCGKTSPVMSQQLSQISREIGDLLRQSPHCMLPASKFIPSYHHHFGRQCRVADYGYTKLAELFEALPHVLQVLGTGDRKVLTLSHRAQVKRFITDMLKVLKSQPGKLLSTDELPQCYERVLARQFDITHYGVAFLEDLFMDIPPTSILITLEGNKTIMAIPKRDQTPEEMERTKQFALEVVDLLKHNPMCRMAFNKFIPAYHHHFGRQCRVADYGFTKLTDLFECISQVVEILEDQEERMLKLTAPEMRAVLSEQIVGLVREYPGQCLPVSQLMLAFQRQYGFPLCLVDYGVNSVIALLGKIKHCVSVEQSEGCDCVVLRHDREMPTLALRVLQLLMDQSGGCLPLVELCSRYKSTFSVELDVHKVQDELSEYVQVSTESDDGSALIRLSALQTFGRDIRAMLRKTGSIPLSSIAQTYVDHFYVELKPALYGYPDIHSLLRALPHIVSITGRAGRNFVGLSPVLASPVPCQEDEELMHLDLQVNSRPRFEDFLSAPVPSAVPSPELRPCPNLPDLMRFEQCDYGDKVWEMSEEERQGLRTPLCRTPTSDLLHLAASSLPPLPKPQPILSSFFPGNVPLTSIFSPPTAEASATQIPHTGGDAAQSVLSPSLGPSSEAVGSTLDEPKEMNISGSAAPTNAQLVQGSRWWQPNEKPDAGHSQGHSTSTSSSSITVGTNFLSVENSVWKPLSEDHVGKPDIEADAAVDTSTTVSAASQLTSPNQQSTALGSDTWGCSGAAPLTQPSPSDMSQNMDTKTHSLPASSSHTPTELVSAGNDVAQPFSQLHLSEERTTDSEASEMAVADAGGQVLAASEDASLSGSQADQSPNAAEVPKFSAEDVGAAGDASAVVKDADTHTPQCNAVKQGQQQVTMNAAGDASSVTIKLDNADNDDEGSSSAEAVRESSQIPKDNDDAAAQIQTTSVDDSFSFGQPLDTSSTRSGENSDPVSPHVSPRKTPRRSRLAAKFLNPIASEPVRIQSLVQTGWHLHVDHACLCEEESGRGRTRRHDKGLPNSWLTAPDSKAKQQGLDWFTHCVFRSTQGYTEMCTLWVDCHFYFVRGCVLLSYGQSCLLLFQNLLNCCWADSSTGLRLR